MQKTILNNRKTKKSSKRLALKGHFVLTTEEILEKVRKAEEETASRAGSWKTGSKTGASQRGKKRKRLETPSEDEEESSCNSNSDASDCIVVRKF
ncbi:MAG: hypothetical protein M1813_002239 [Trichoglossum hirsutum]|nr:MAG: hypothetical protein M1813_002239 [Trichoglossum hirsutum]